MLKNAVSVCFTCLLFIVLTNCQDQTDTNSHRIKEYYSNRCYTQTKNHTYYMQLSEEFKSFEAFFESTFASIPDRTKEFCEYQREHLNNGFHRVVKKLEPCLPPQEKYLSQFLRDSFKGFLHFMCHNNGVYTKSLFSSQNQQCLHNLEGDITSRLTSCFGRIFKPRSGYLTKKDVCEDIHVAEKCYEVILDEKCPRSGSYKDLSKTFFRFVSEPCSGCISQINILLLILSVILPYMFSKK